MIAPEHKNESLPVVRPDSTLQSVTQALENSTNGLVVVLDDKDCLIGVITDRRLRQAIIGGHRIDTTADQFMDTDPHRLPDSSSDHEVLRYMEQNNLTDLPLVDTENHVTRIARYDQFSKRPLKNSAVIMAGGKGKRLMPLTQNIPKPMLKIGGKPMIARIIEALYRSGIRTIYVSLGYKADLINDFLKNIDLPELVIKPVYEDQPLGTGGSLSLIEDRLEHPFLVLNADVITNLDLRELIRFHEQHDAEMTVGVTSYQLQIPFGVLDMDEFEITGVSEKPRLDFPIIAGIYVISPTVLDLMEHNVYQDLPDMIPKLVNAKRRVVGFPIWEKWMDIGSHEQFAMAQRELGEN